jgi:membrane protease YdiL (CAAX protease family)
MTSSRAAESVKSDDAQTGTFDVVRRPFRGAIGLNPRTGVLLVLIFGAVRMALVLQANVTGSYQVVSLVFVAMALLPWILLNRSGRQRMGVTRPARSRWLLPGFLAGIACCLITFAIVTLLWGESTANPFSYIAGSYSAVPDAVSEADRVIYFAIFAAIGMLFSPIGEELLYRGIAHESFAARLGDRGAALLDAGAFAVVHLAHFGIVYLAGAWAFLPVPATVWVGAMFFSSLVFYAFRALTGSILGSIVCHAGFNLAMNFVIFYALGVL